MAQDLLLNFCLMVTLTYGLSQTYQMVEVGERRRLLGLRLIVEALLPVVLVALSTPLLPGVLLDLRAVPLALIAVRRGPLLGVVLALPLIVYRLNISHQGQPGAMMGIASVLLLATLLRGRLYPNRQLPPVRHIWPYVLLLFAPYAVTLPLLNHDPDLYLQAYLPLLGFNVLGYLSVNSMIRGRLRLLELADGFRAQAHQDALSGLGNRRQFDGDLLGLAPGDLLLLLDLDHFKQVNDRFGHPAGDAVIGRVGQVLQASLRARDRAYRYGGEEFALILGGAGRGDPVQIAERFRTQITEGTRDLLDGRGVTVSVGVVVCGPARALPAVWLARADQALYHAKQAGRDRVHLWPP